MVTVSIVGVTSYTGLELLRLLAQHPHFIVTSVTGRSAVGKRLNEVFPQLQALTYAGYAKKAVNPLLIIGEEPEQTDLAFVCLPHAAAAETVVKLLERGTRVVDLSADFRLRKVAEYEEWYKHTHPAPALLESAVYGLCERYRNRIAEATLVANPGCHATTAILALLPAFAAGLIAADVIVDSKTGISGAGRGLTLGTHYAEANEDVSAYGLSGHRHLPEIVQELEAGARAGGHPLETPLRVTFVPHLMPMTRGILATCYANFKQSERIPTTAQIRAIYEAYYADEPFVHVVDQAPHTKWTYGSNACVIYPMVDARTGRFVVIACLDNLVKGAAGQAIQNANRLSGLLETTGLPALALYP
ncbi:MAG TPA: N-acetyl-gamma-glutamyl-phosphate reductase [Ktedonobacteraceae bacterium]|nr:N-acetyl-gamma-glutamyl-phosphate reductase [Ktedonobacteraceae bacterium]